MANKVTARSAIAPKPIFDIYGNIIGNKEDEREVCKPSKVNVKKPIKHVNNLLILPDWTTLTEFEPFYDFRTKTYKITIQTIHNDPNQVFLQEAKIKGVRKLFEIYGKILDEDRINATLNVAIALDWFIPLRPNIVCSGNNIPLFGMKVLIGIPGDIFDVIPIIDRTNILETLPLPNWEVELVSSQLRSKLKEVSGVIRGYAKDAEKLKGQIGVNLNKEADRLEQLYLSLQNLLIANGFYINEEQDDLIIIGIDDKYKIIYVLFDNGEEFTRLSSGFDNFLKTRPVDNDRTVNYILNIGTIQRLGQTSKELTLIDFLKDLTTRTPGIALVEQIQAGTTSPDDLIVRLNSKSSKTEDEKSAEDAVLSSPGLRKSISETTKDKKDFVGDVVLDIKNFGSLLKKVHSLDDVYQEILNKISVVSLIEAAIKCFIGDPCLIIKAKLASLGCKEFLHVYRKQAGLNIFNPSNVPGFEANVRINVKRCLSSLNASEQQILLGRIQFKFGQPVRTIDATDAVPVAILFEALGSRGDEILENACDDPQVKESLINSIPDDVCKILDLDLSKLKIPTINLNDLIPTIDIMALIVIQIEAAIIEALITALVNMIKSIIDGILENCGDIRLNNFGLINLDELIAKSINIEPILGMKLGFFKNLNIYFTTANLPNIIKDLRNLFNDTASLLTSNELTNLLNGNASDDVIKIINCLVSNKYSGLTPALDSSAKIEDIFDDLGKLVDKELLLDQISQRSDVYGNIKPFCDISTDDGRKQLLSDKGLTPEQIDHQVAKANQRKAEYLKDLTDLLGKNNILDGVIPPVFCKDSAQMRGMIPRDHPSFTHLLDKTIDVMYDGIQTAFNQDISGFTTVLKETTSIQKPRKVTRKQKFRDSRGNSTDVANPEFLRIVANGAVVKKPNDLDGDDVIVYEDQNFITNFVSKTLKTNLENIEFDSRLSKLDFNENKISIIIPSNIDSSILSAPSGNILGGSPVGPLSGPLNILNDLSILQNQIGLLKPVSYKIDYVFPNNGGIKGNKFKYGISISSVIGTGSEVIESFNTSSYDIVPTNILSFIQNNRLGTLEGVSLQQSYFSDFVSNIWANGANIYRDNNIASKPDYAKGIGVNDNINTINGKFRDKVKFELYQNIFLDVLSSVARKVSKSPLFDSKILSLIDFTPEKLPGEKCAPSLLNLSKIKNKVKEDYSKSECVEDISVSSDGLGNNFLNSLEKSGIYGAIETFIRLHVVEFVLRSIFVFSEFKLSNIKELNINSVSYYSNEIINSINSFSELSNDPDFKTQFKEQTLDLVNARGIVTEDFNFALNELTKEQLVDVIKVISKLIGSVGNLNIENVIVEEFLPFFEVPNGNLRFTDITAANLNNLSQITNPIGDKKSTVIFNLDNGSLILERYVRLDDRQDNNNSEVQLMREGDGLFGVANVNDFNNFVNLLKNVETRTGNKINFANEFSGLSYGLRLSYVPKFKSSFKTEGPANQALSTSTAATILNDVSTPGTQPSSPPDESLTSGLFTDEARIKLLKASRFDKSFEIFEGINTTVQGYFKDLSLSKTNREINIFPIVCVEISEPNLESFTTSDNIIEKWNSKSQELRDMLISSQEFKFLFDFCFPLGTMLSLITIYNSVYLSNIKPLNDLFNNTKASIKTVFQTLLNSGDYRHQDSLMKQLGGNAGISTTAHNNIGNNSDIPAGMSSTAMAARTPFLILKGLVELTDTNINRAVKIVDFAKSRGKEVSILAASLGQLPMNVFPVPPIGPGIGPPITPLGFIYLSLGISSIFESAKGKDIKREAIKADPNVNLNFGRIDC